MFCFSQIQLGDSLNSINIVRKEKILISPNQVQDGYVIEKDNIIYNLCVNSDGKIYFISTDDPNFEFQKLHVSSIFKEIKNVKNKYNIKGWGYVVENEFDWKYAFNTSKIKINSKIAFFFKFDSKLNDSKMKAEIKVKL